MRGYRRRGVERYEVSDDKMMFKGGRRGNDDPRYEQERISFIF